MRRLACSLALLVLLAGCRRGPGAIDPLRPDQLAPCPSGAPHLVIALATGHSDEEQALLRYDQTLSACRGAVVPYADYGTIASVGGLSDGTDLVGFSGPYGRGGLLVRFEETTERGRVEDESLLPVSIAALSFEGRPAVAVVWGSRSSSDDGDRLDVYAEDDLARLGSWDVTYSLVRAAAPPSGQPGRIAALIGEGLQEYRADPGGTTLATTGELQVARPSNTGVLRSLDVLGDRVRVAGDDGVLSWRLGAAPAFLGPVHCRWPRTTSSPLPEETADHAAALVDPSAPDESLVLVSGELRGGSDASSHLFRMTPRGECELVESMPGRYRGVAMSWAGR